MKPNPKWWKAVRIWEGDTVYIIGGGPSLKSQFHLLKELEDRPTLGVNAAYKLGPWVNIVYFGDAKFFEWNWEELSHWPGLVVTTCHAIADRKPSYVKFIKRQARGWSEDPRFCAWNGNSGAAACCLAYLMGAGRLVLLGFDMKSEGSVVQNWHKYHRREGNPKVHIRHKEQFKQVMVGAKGCGLEIINASPDSALEGFPKISLEECLEKYK